MRKLRKTSISLLELIALDPTYTATSLANHKRLSLPTISKCLKRLARDGYIAITNRGKHKELRLTERGIQHLAFSLAIKERLTINEEKANTQKSTITTSTRMENYCLKYPLKDKLDIKEPAIILKLTGIEPKEVIWKNNTRQIFHIGDITAQLNTASLELWAPHIYTNSAIPSIVPQAKAKAILDPIALKLEARLQKFARFKLKRLDLNTLYSERVDIELEEESHALAQAKPKDYKFKVYHPLDGRERADIDYSRTNKQPEFAFKHRKTAPTDRDTMNAQFNALFDGEVSLLDINGLIEISRNNTQSIVEFHKWLANHDAQITADRLEKEAMTLLINDLREDLKRKNKADEEREKAIADLGFGISGQPVQASKPKSLWERLIKNLRKERKRP